MLPPPAAERTVEVSELCARRRGQLQEATGLCPRELRMLARTKAVPTPTFKVANRLGTPEMATMAVGIKPPRERLEPGAAAGEGAQKD